MLLALVATWQQYIVPSQHPAHGPGQPTFALCEFTLRSQSLCIRCAAGGRYYTFQSCPDMPYLHQQPYRHIASMRHGDITLLDSGTAISPATTLTASVRNALPYSVVHACCTASAAACRHVSLPMYTAQACRRGPSLCQKWFHFNGCALLQHQWCCPTG
jgi:hypothetical protein